MGGTVDNTGGRLHPPTSLTVKVQLLGSIMLGIFEAMEDYELDWCFGRLLCFVTPTLSKERKVDDERGYFYGLISVNTSKLMTQDLIDDDRTLGRRNWKMNWPSEIIWNWLLFYLYLLKRNATDRKIMTTVLCKKKRKSLTVWRWTVHRGS